jgi:signal transduction histidine kinase
VATGGVVLVFQPLHMRLQRAINRLMYGERDNPYLVLSRLGERLESTLAPDAMLPTVAETLKDALRLPYVAIALDHEGSCITAAAAGQPVADTLELPLNHQGEEIGLLILGPRAPGDTFSPSDLRLLGDLVRQIALAAHTQRLTVDLQRSRERLVTAREEERRRLRRDLHDGLGPALAAQTLKVGSARALYGRNPVAADALLGELENDIEAALQDIRRLVYNLRPPALDELGLAGAIRELTTRHFGGVADTQSLAVVLDAPEQFPVLPAAVEVAAYRIVQEALANVVCHANARRCDIRLRLDPAPAMLTIEISDDGIGLPHSRSAGVGTTSMRERAAELGGSCVIAGRPEGGTLVQAQIPVPATAVAASNKME